MRTTFRFPSPRFVQGLLLILALITATAALASPICDLETVTDPIAQSHCCASLDDAVPVPLAAGAANERPADLVPVLPAALLKWRLISRRTIEIPPDRPSPSRPYHVRSSRILA